MTDQWVTVGLAGGRQKIAGVTIDPDFSNGPKDVEIRVSTTTSDGAAFTTVLSTTLPTNTTRTLYFDTLVDAKYVQFYWRNGYATTTIGVAGLEVLGRSDLVATVVGVSSEYSGSTSGQAALDLTEGGGWTTASGATADQKLKIMLPGDRTWLVDHVALQRQTDGAAADGPRNFEVWVSATTGGRAFLQPRAQRHFAQQRHPAALPLPEGAGTLCDAGGAEQLGWSELPAGGQLPGVLAADRRH